ncbi:MAG TPA: hypothetical protein VGB27_05475 [Candidatus Binatia bacterium]
MPTTPRMPCVWPRCAGMVTRPANRYIVFQVLPHTLGLGPEVWRVLAKCHEIRNLGEYEGDLNIDDQLVKDLISACRAVAARLDTLKPPAGAK